MSISNGDTVRCYNSPTDLWDVVQTDASREDADAESVWVVGSHDSDGLVLVEKAKNGRRVQLLAPERLLTAVD